MLPLEKNTIGNIDTSALKKKLNEAIGERNLLQKQLDATVERLSLNENQLNDALQARVILQTVAEQTQKQIEYKISNLVSLALASVFPDPYSFILRFVKRRDKTEADLLFCKNGNEGSPMTVSGGGPLDVASYALRPSLWSICPTRNVLFLDEPFRFVSRDLQHKCSEMMKMIGEKLNIQHILISHIPEIMEKADTTFEIVNIEGVSKVNKKHSAIKI
jgi:hypothetical protein